MYVMVHTYTKIIYVYVLVNLCHGLRALTLAKKEVDHTGDFLPQYRQAFCGVCTHSAYSLVGLRAKWRGGGSLSGGRGSGGGGARLGTICLSLKEKRGEGSGGGFGAGPPHHHSSATSR